MISILTLVRTPNCLCRSLPKFQSSKVTLLNWWSQRHVWFNLLICKFTLVVICSVVNWDCCKITNTSMAKIKQMGLDVYSDNRHRVAQAWLESVRQGWGRKKEESGTRRETNARCTQLIVLHVCIRIYVQTGCIMTFPLNFVHFSFYVINL